MGTKNSKLNYDITVKLNQDHRANRYAKKLLILGPAKSGKSTLFHRLKFIHGRGFSQTERLQLKSQIYKYIIHSMQQILKCIEQYKYKFQLNEISQQCSQILLNIDLDDYEDIYSLNINHNNDIMTYIHILTQQSSVQDIIKNANKYYIDESIEYFLNLSTIQRVSDYDEYLPNNDDIISFRHRKKGNNNLSEVEINIRNDKFIIYDVNYDLNYLSKNKNKPVININNNNKTNSYSKWMHCFDSSTALIYVTSLVSYSEYIVDEEENYLDRIKMKIAMDLLIDIVGIDVLELIMTFIDDPFEIGKNAMIESIRLFENIINNKYFYHIPIILMLNKKDLLLNRIQFDDEMKLFLQCFPQFNQLICYKECIDYIQNEFCKQNKNPERHIYTHFTCATTDNNVVERLFNDVQSIVLEHCLRMGNHI